MADMEKDASYMDVVERALYNTLYQAQLWMEKAFLCKSSGSMAGKLYAENFTRTCETCQAEMVWCCMLPAKHYQNIGISWTNTSISKEENEIYVNLYVANENRSYT